MKHSNPLYGLIGINLLAIKIDNGGGSSEVTLVSHGIRFCIVKNFTHFSELLNMHAKENYSV